MQDQEIQARGYVRKIKISDETKTLFFWIMVGLLFGSWVLKEFFGRMT